ncbi:MAG: hypothetical protein ACTHVE_00825 [Senegalia sp. (in: firmicutes)]|uniref:hypothetical protein n=1 Tax=Senegalia sp. (in: firmicutes) TaxID=1924098 RepID=UPI003F99DCF1
MKKKWLLPLLLVLIVSLALAGCADDADDMDDTDTGDTDVKEDVDDAADDAKDAVDDTADDAEDAVRDMTYEDIKVTPEEAFDKFMELHPDAKVKELEIDKELTEYQYVIEGYDKEKAYEVKLNPVDSNVISDDEEEVDLDDENAEITKDHVAKVDSIIEKAKKEDGSDSELDEWNISVEDGKLVMDVEIGATEYTYDLDTEELIENDM